MSFNEPSPGQPGQGGYGGKGYGQEFDQGYDRTYGNQGSQGGYGDQEDYGGYDGWSRQQPPQSQQPPYQQPPEPLQSSWGTYEEPEPPQSPQRAHGYADPEPEPPRGRPRRAVVTLVAGVAALLAIAGLGLVLVLGNGSDDGPAVRLTTPKTLHDGDYVLQKDSAALEKEGTTAQDDMPEGVTSVAGQYGHKDDAQSGLVISGGYGRIGDKSAVQDGMFKGMESSSQATVATARKNYTVGGQTFSCEVIKLRSSGTDVFAPVCTWADGTAAAMVMDVDARTGVSLATVNVEEFARVTAQIKAEITVPVE